MIAGHASMDAAVAITGLGFVSPLGHDLPAVWQALCAGTSRPVRHEHRLGGEVWGAFPLYAVRDFEPRAVPFGPEARAWADATHLWDDADVLYLAAAGQRALGDAGLAEPGRGGDLGLVVTHENPGVDRHVDLLLEAAGEAAPPQTRRDAAERLYARHRDAVYNLQTFMPLHRVARMLGAHGHGLIVNNACASGLYALDAAAALVRDGSCRAVVVAGADHPLSWTKHRWFAEQELAAEDGDVRPFDRERHGFVLGDGGAALVLERLDAARARGARAYAVYRGGGFNQEGWKVTMPDPASRHYERALAAALQRAGLRPADVDWIVAHGAATGLADAYEARSLVAVFGAEFERPRLTALKAHVGHNLGGSGVTETGLLLLAMRHGRLPETRGCITPDPALRLRPLQNAAQEAPRFALKCAAGFGGFNAACIFERLE
jgi:3-oxoacyl-(acyl-carrier-protein) synthase